MAVFFLGDLACEVTVLLVPAPQKRRDEGLLASEMMKQACVREVCATGNLPQGCSVEAVLDETI